MRQWQTIRASALGHHTHRESYAAVVLSGGYEEAGDCGRFQVEAGDVILHERFEAHLDRFPVSGAVVLNLRLPEGRSFLPGRASIADADSIARAVEKNPAEAADLLLSAIAPRPSRNIDWPDELAASLIHNPSICLSLWSESKGLAPWTVSRGFAQIFGISPSAFRLRARARHAWKAIQTSKEPLAEIAADLDFADQAHMTRSVKQLTGTAPLAWRQTANRFKTS